MSFASASARARLISTNIISLPTPFMTRAKPEVDPTNPQPTMPIFIDRPAFIKFPTNVPNFSQIFLNGFYLKNFRQSYGSRAEEYLAQGFVCATGPLFAVGIHMAAFSGSNASSVWFANTPARSWARGADQSRGGVCKEPWLTRF